MRCGGIGLELGRGLWDGRRPPRGSCGWKWVGNWVLCRSKREVCLLYLDYVSFMLL